MLHIGDGDVVVESLRRAALPGMFLPWLDVLHDGAVPQVATLGELSEIRSRALADLGAAPLRETRTRFAARDAVLESSRGEDEIVLWYSHGLTGQLQLIQLLDWLKMHRGRDVSLIEIASYRGVQGFVGIGQLRADQLATLFPERRPVEPEQYDLAARAWRAFRAPEPAELDALARGDTSALPYLGDTLRRLREEYPSVTDGLSRTQRQLLNAASQGRRSKTALYLATRADERVPLGDWSIFWRIEDLATGLSPALERSADEEFALTGDGRRLLAGEADWPALQGVYDRWIGGVHLTGASPAWRWDEDARRIVAA